MTTFSALCVASTAAAIVSSASPSTVVKPHASVGHVVRPKEQKRPDWPAHVAARYSCGTFTQEACVRSRALRPADIVIDVTP